jgi:hypothetical protein
MPWAVAGIGLAILVAALITGATGATRIFAWSAAIVGLVIAFLHWFSPAWSLLVELDDQGLRVLRKDDVRLQLGWHEVERLLVDREHSTAVVDGGTAERRLLVPGPGLSGPYRIEDRGRLIIELCARVPIERQAPLRP